MKHVGTISIGIKAPIIRMGDDLASIVTDSVSAAASELNLTFSEKDVVAVTEAVVARAQGNYATTSQIAADVRAKTGGGKVGVIFPILSRNRFSMILKGISKACDKVVIQLSYPSDEVGNPLISPDDLDKSGVNPYSDNFDEEGFRKKFGALSHPFTQVDYLKYYRKICPDCEIILSNRPEYILGFADTVIVCDIHKRRLTKKQLMNAGTKKVVALDEILISSVDGSGYNPEYGLLGSNLATEDSVKLFPRNPQIFVEKLEKALFDKTGVRLRVMVYGDGAFKDPFGGIWELADPVVSPAHSQSLLRSPNELKLKYIADTDLKNAGKGEAEEKMKEMIRRKGDLTGEMSGQGTTPRRLTDLLGSLCDLTSGSGDKGTPIILIKGYFDNYADD